jgi:hypothetical protein
MSGLRHCPNPRIKLDNHIIYGNFPYITQNTDFIKKIHPCQISKEAIP